MAVAGLRPAAAGEAQNPGTAEDVASWFWHEFLPGAYPMRVTARGLLNSWNTQPSLCSWLVRAVAVFGFVLAVPPTSLGQPTLPDPLVGTWEVPAASPVQTLSGVVLFRGWTCDPAVMAVRTGTVVEIQIGINPRERAAVGTFRPDTNMSASGPCLGDNNGWGITTNVTRFGPARKRSLSMSTTPWSSSG